MENENAVAVSQNENAVSQKFTFAAIFDLLTDAQQTAVLDIQEYDGKKIEETLTQIVKLGISARQNSIKATRERDAQKAKSDKLDAFNKFVAQGMNIADALMFAGLATKETLEQSKKAA